ncbi:hypothetical protein DFH11DRAFT_1734619 [Phellopilus nigrolimitatus]|nr:hypothetical protein DFH11DRAFT_1734619 [Phellopilus nigrolimitatus]
MAEYDIYARQMYSMKRGLGLLEPNPAVHQFDRVRVGDVGYVEFGSFYRLFNIFYDSDHEINSRGVPDDFEPLPLNRQEVSTREPLMPGVRKSTGVRRVGVEACATGVAMEPGAKVKLVCESRQGAALITKNFIKCEDAVRMKAMEDYIRKNCNSWHEFAISEGRDIQPRDLILVTGCDLTADWAIATFSEQFSGVEVSFEVGGPVASAGVSLWGKWSSTVEIPGYRIARRLFWLKKLSAAAEPKDFDGEPPLSDNNLTREIEKLGEPRSDPFATTNVDEMVVHDDDIIAHIPEDSDDVIRDLTQALAVQADLCTTEQPSLNADTVIPAEPSDSYKMHIPGTGHDFHDHEPMLGSPPARDHGLEPKPRPEPDQVQPCFDPRQDAPPPPTDGSSARDVVHDNLSTRRQTNPIATAASSSYPLNIRSRNFWSEKEASRKFVDLIRRSSSWWANWNPSIQITAGDYGEIDFKSGQFMKEGNIYTSSDKSIADLAAQFEPASEAVLDHDVAGFANAYLKGQWQFNHSRGAFLIMHMPRLTRVPDEFLAESLSRGLLKGRTLVTHVYSCPAYALYLSNKTNETVSIALAADVPSIVAPGVSPGAGIGTKWVDNGTAGLLQKGYNDEAVFVPLYSIRKIAKRKIRRESFDENAPVGDFWANVEAPWGFLDDDGEEEVIEYMDESDSD